MTDDARAEPGTATDESRTPVLDALEEAAQAVLDAAAQAMPSATGDDVAAWAEVVGPVAEVDPEHDAPPAVPGAGLARSALAELHALAGGDGDEGDG